MTIRIAVVEDHAIVGSALCGALGAVEGLAVVGMASTADDALALVARTQPDVVLLDLLLGSHRGADVIPELRRSAPAARVLVVTAWATEHAMDLALSRGALGLLSKLQPLAELVDGVRRVDAGHVVVCPALVPALVRRATAGRETAVEPRDVELLELLAQARTTSEIAGAMCMSEHTVRNRIRILMAKLGVHTRVEAVSEGLRRGYVLPQEPVMAGSGLS